MENNIQELKRDNNDKYDELKQLLINTTNTNEDDYLTQIEREAYELGNITFRNWEDGYKKQL